VCGLGVAHRSTFEMRSNLRLPYATGQRKTLNRIPCRLPHFSQPDRGNPDRGGGAIVLLALAGRLL
jgi:hypothetical protein